MTENEKLNLAIAASHETAEKILAAGKRIYSVDRVGGEGIKAQIDKVAHKCLYRRLSPIAPVYSEESKDRFDPRQHSEFWLIDPVDGTTNCINGIPLWTVSIAYIRDGQTVFGVINAPILGELYTVSDRAYLNGKPIRTSRNVRLEDSVIAVNATWLDRPSKTNRLWRTFDPPMCFRRRLIESGALELAWVAAGRLHGVVHPHNSPWDHAVGGLLVRKAGGVVSNFSNDSWDPFARGTLAACTTELYGQIFSLVRLIYPS